MLNLFRPPEDVPEEPSDYSVMGLRRKIPLLIGIGVMLWLMLAKTFPGTFAPHSVDPNGPIIPHKARHKSENATPVPVEPNQDNIAPVPVAPKPVPEPVPEPVVGKPAVEKPAPVVEKEAAVPVKTIISTELSDADKKHIAQLEEQVASLSGEIASLKTQMKENASGIKKDDQLLDEKLQQHEQAMKQQGEALQGMKQQVESLAAIKQQVETLQASHAERLSEMTAFSILKETVLRGEPFDNEYRQMAAMVHTPEKVALLSQLKPFASDGLPTVSALQAQFEKLLPEALSPGHKSDTLSHNLQSLIRIRREGEPQGTDDESILARSETKINSGEIAGALKELQPLSPPAMDVLAEWAKKARAYVDGRNALNELQVALLREPVPSKPVPAPKGIVPVIPKPPDTKPVEPKPAEAKPVEKAPAEPAPDLNDDDASQRDDEMKDMTVDIIHPAAPVPPPAADSK